MTKELVDSLKKLTYTIIGVSILGAIAILVSYIEQVIQVSHAEGADAKETAEIKQDAEYLCHSIGTVANSIAWIAFAICMSVLVKKLHRI